MATPQIQLQIAVNMQQLNANLQAVNQSIVDMTNQMSQSFARVGGGARIGGAAVDSLAGQLRAVKAEMVTVSRTSNFLAKDIAQLIPISTDARTGLSALIGVAAAGSAGVAIFQAMVAIVGTLIHMYQEWIDAHEKLRRVGLDTAERLGGSLRDLIESFKGLETASTKAWRAAMKPDGDKIKEAVRDVEQMANEPWWNMFRDIVHDIQALKLELRSEIWSDEQKEMLKNHTLPLHAIPAGGPDKSGKGPLWFKGIGSGTDDLLHIDSTLEKINRRLRETVEINRQREGQRGLRDAATDEEQIERNQQTGARIKEMENANADEIVQIRLRAYNKAEEIKRKNHKELDQEDTEATAVLAEAEDRVKEVMAKRDLERKLYAIEQAKKGAEVEVQLQMTAMAETERLRYEYRHRTSEADIKELNARIVQNVNAEYKLIRQFKAKQDAEEAKRIRAEVDDRLRVAVEWIQKYYALEASVGEFDDNLDKRKLQRQLSFVNTQASEVSHKMHELMQMELDLEDTKDFDTEAKEEAHQKRVAAIHLKYAKRRTELEKETEQAVNSIKAAYAAPFIDSLTRNWETGLDQMLMGTYSWANLTKNIYHSIAQAVSSQITHMAGEWLKGQLENVAASQRANIEIVAAYLWGGMQTVAIAVWTGIKFVAIKAYEAAAAAYAAISGIPFVGPFLAPVVAAGVLAAVIGLGAKIASAAGGMDVGSSGAFAMLHPQEMVLPANLANPLRDMVSGGGSGRPISIQINTTDAIGFEDMLKRNQGSLVKILREALKNNRT